MLAVRSHVAQHQYFAVLMPVLNGVEDGINIISAAIIWWLRGVKYFNGVVTKRYGEGVQ